MAEINDTDTFRHRVVKLGLVPPERLDEVYLELGDRNPPLQEMVRVLERKNYLTPWQTSKLLKGETDGYFLGGYRILYKIASGSFGRVFRAEDSISGRMVAIKVLRKRWSEDQNRIDLFAREGNVGLKLKHENIVEVIAVSKDPATGQYYFVMEFVEGGNLRDILQIRQKLDVPESLRIIEDAAMGLAYAYSRGVSHRDIKMTNILLSSTKTAKLVDFGLAQYFAASDKEEKQRVERTVDYAGLERATGVKPGDVRSDIFFLGCVLFEMLTGRAPIEMTRDRNARMSMRRFQEIPPLPPSEVQAPASVFSLVDNMLTLDPTRRFQTPTQLLDAIRTARREIDGGTAGNANVSHSLFIVERDEGLQNKLRDKFKKLGYRVLLSGDPTRALERYRQQPFDALIVDAATVGDDGRLVYQQLLAEATQKRLAFVAVLMLSKKQADVAERIPPVKNAAVLIHPVTLGKLQQQLEELLAPAG